MRLLARPLTADAFARFGEVLQAPAAPGRAYFDRALANRRPAASASLSIVLQEPLAGLPLRVAVMERHPYSSQSFIPLDAGRWLVVVAPRSPEVGGGPDMARALAFLARNDQGVTYGVGVWHHPFAVLDRAARFAVVMWRDGTAADDDFAHVPAFEVHAPD